LLNESQVKRYELKLKKIKIMQNNKAILTAVKAIKNGKFQIELTQVLKSEKSVNLLALMNEGDERFTNNEAKARKAWMSCEKSSLVKYLGINEEDLDSMKDGETKEYSIESPKIGNFELNIQVSETIEPTEFQAINSKKTAKQIVDKNGERKYFVKENNLVYSNTSIVAGEPKHKFITDALLVSESEVFSSPLEQKVIS
jgi:hypothetical protein